MRETKFRILHQNLADDTWGWDYFNLPDDLGFDEEIYINSSRYIMETFTEYIGLKDKNGKKIYEGDVVSGWIPGTESDEDFVNGEIRFEEGSFDIYNGNEYLGDLASCTLNKSIEVIGNIHENKDLLK